MIMQRGVQTNGLLWQTPSLALTAQAFLLTVSLGGDTFRPIRVVDRDRGRVARVGGAFAENPVDDGELYALAERRLGAAAAESDVLDRAEDNTRGMLTSLAQSLGVDEVTVEFEAAPAAAR